MTQIIKQKTEYFIFFKDTVILFIATGNDSLSKEKFRFSTS